MRKSQNEDSNHQTILNESSNDPEIPNTGTIDLTSLRITSQRTRAQITSLENQLSKLSKANKQLSIDLSNIELKLQNSENQKSQLISDTEQMDHKLKEITNSRNERVTQFLQHKKSFEEQKTQLQNQINLLKDNNCSLEHELSKQKSYLLQLQNQLTNKETEITLLENEISKYKSPLEKAVVDASTEPNVDILEGEISRLNNQAIQIDQKKQELETFLSSLQNRLRKEIDETIQKKKELEDQLQFEQDQTKKLNLELESTHQLSISARESVERQWRRRIDEQRSKHHLNMEQIHQSYSTSSNQSNLTGQKLIQILQNIENVRSENNALEMIIQNQHQIENDNRYTISIGINKRNSARKMVTLTSVLPNRFDENSIIYKVVRMIDISCLHTINVMNRYPSIRVLFIFLFIFANFFWIMHLFL